MSKDRDYAAEMRALLDEEATKTGDPAPVIAERIVKRLREKDPELLRGWLDANAQGFIREAINHADRSTRGRLRKTGSRSVFAEDAERFEAGDPDAMGRWLDARYKVAGGVRKRLEDMTADDLNYAADEYEQAENENRFEKAFLRALAKKVGRGGTVGGRLSEEQIRSIRDALGSK